MNCAQCRECGLVGDLVFSQEGAPHMHQSVPEILRNIEFVGRQLIASSMIFSDPPTRGKYHACVFANVFSGSAATQLRWGAWQKTETQKAESQNATLKRQKLKWPKNQKAENFAP